MISLIRTNFKDPLEIISLIYYVHTCFYPNVQNKGIK